MSTSVTGGYYLLLFLTYYFAFIFEMTLAFKYLTPEQLASPQFLVPSLLMFSFLVRVWGQVGCLVERTQGEKRAKGAT